MKKERLSIANVIHPATASTAKQVWPEHHQTLSSGIPNDHFVERNGVQYAGTHLIIDFWGAAGLDNLELMERTLRACVEKCHATLLHLHLHHFTSSGGISGVAVLAESHISVHTWPERDFAAFDIFMCGSARPEEAISVLKRAFSPKTMKITENLRGIVDHE